MGIEFPSLIPNLLDLYDIFAAFIHLIKFRFTKNHDKAEDIRITLRNCVFIRGRTSKRVRPIHSYGRASIRR
jgi:hypothetical protein